MSLLTNYSLVIPCASILVGVGSVIIKCFVKSVHARWTARGCEITVDSAVIPPFNCAV